MTPSEINIEVPGRVCLFGDHQDYLGFPVIACAINRHITLRAKPNSEKRFNIHLPDLNESRIIPIEEQFNELTSRDYFGSGIKVFLKQGYAPNVGFDIQISGNIPINAGLSSSSALITAWILFLFKAYTDRTLSKRELAQFTHHAEVIEHREPGGNMDQFTIAYGGLIKINTCDPVIVYPIEQELPTMVIADSGVSKSTLDGLQETKTKSLEAISAFQKLKPETEISSTTLENIKNVLNEIPLSLQPFLEAAIENVIITEKAYQLLNDKNVNWETLGSLMSQHQSVLRDKLKVSVQEIDILNAAALSSGALGAKIIGSGGGGCAVALVKENENEVKSAMLKAGAKQCFIAKMEYGAITLNS